MGDDTLAQVYLEQACAAFRQAANLGDLTVDLIHLGTTWLRRDHQRAAACFSEAHALALALKDRSLEGMTRNNLGEMARMGGDYSTAAAHYTASLHLMQATDRRNEIPRLLHNLGYVALHSGDTGAAHEYFRHSLDQFHPQDRRGVAEALDGLAAIASVCGVPLTAARWWGATAAALGQMHVTAWPADQLELIHYSTIARSACDSEAFAGAWTMGQTLTLEQAVAEAVARDPL